MSCAALWTADSGANPTKYTNPRPSSSVRAPTTLLSFVRDLVRDSGSVVVVVFMRSLIGVIKRALPPCKGLAALQGLEKHSDCPCIGQCYGATGVLRLRDFGGASSAAGAGDEVSSTWNRCIRLTSSGGIGVDLDVCAEINTSTCFTLIRNSP